MDDNNEMQSAKYWLFEQPEVLQTGKNTIRYYPKAERLVIHLPDYIKQDFYGGEIKPGKGVGLQLVPLSENQEVLKRIIEILSGYLIE